MGLQLTAACISVSPTLSSLYLPCEQTATANILGCCQNWLGPYRPIFFPAVSEEAFIGRSEDCMKTWENVVHTASVARISNARSVLCDMGEIRRASI